MTNLNEMFVMNSNGAETTGSRNLTGTAQLTNLALTKANKVLEIINEDLQSETPVGFKELWQASMNDHLAMDKLIAVASILDETDATFLKDIDDETINGMLKSQQSKRSRAKGKQMTKENYTIMLTGAIAESYIRLVCGKSKSSVKRTVGEVNFTEEALERLANDQDDLRRELRNVQSKKSIMKSKADFDENSDGWQALLRAEEALKSIRVPGGSGNTRLVEVDATKQALAELLGQIDSDLTQYSKKNLIEQLEAVKKLLNYTETAASESQDESTGDTTEESAE